MEMLHSFSTVTIVSYLTVVCISVFIFVHCKRKRRVFQLIGQLPGPLALPVIGNTIEINVEHDEMFTRLMCTPNMWGGDIGINRAWLGDQPYIFLFKAHTVEIILSSNKHIDKSMDYNYLHPWLGSGLLTSSGRKWHSRRKILTPTFHFRILEDFIEVFREQSDLLVERLRCEVNNTGFNFFPYITLCALDIICETAMGKKVHAQENSSSEYVKAVYEIGNIILCRQAKIWLQSDWLFRWSSLYKSHQRCIRILHGFSNKVIRERKEEFFSDTKVTQNMDQMLGKKKRLAFLDLLIEASEGGTILSNEDIREEVDTFMFEGHDTTSAAISWCLFLLGNHSAIQDRVYEEIEQVLGNEALSMKGLQELRYLECCIKEALRLYPSVPMMGRKLQEDAKIGNFLIPSGTTAIIMTYMLHRDADVFPLPEIFDPDRFLPENVRGRHPYSYIPFSAGPRNCIGQKFALLEEKAVIASVLRSYQVIAIDKRENLTLLGELILRPKNGLAVRITPRSST